MRFSPRNGVFSVLSLAVMCLIFWFSSKDAGASTEQSDFFIYLFLEDLFEGQIPTLLSVIVRKIAHFSVYGALGFCLYYALEGVPKRVSLGLVAPFILTVLYAVSDEVHQMFVPGRAGTVFDLAVDSVGAAVGILTAAILLCLIRLIKKRRSCR